MISLTRELTSDLDVVSCSQLGFFIHAESLGVGRAAGYNPVGQDKYIPYLTLHTVHTLNFPALKHLSRLLPTLQHSQTLWIPLGSALLTRHSSAERFPLEPYHIGLFLLQLLKCAALERSSVLLICLWPKDMHVTSLSNKVSFFFLVFSYFNKYSRGSWCSCNFSS